MTPPPEQAGASSDATAPDESDDFTGAEDAERRAARVETVDHGERLDKWLVMLAGEFSRSHLKTLVEDGLVQVDGRPVTSASRRVSAGQWIEVGLRPTAETRAFRAEPEVAARWTTVFEDDHLLVIDKPAGLVVHPAPGHWSGTLLNGLLAVYAGAATLPRGGIVHRLDKDTSGLMVVARSLVAMTALTRAIAAREVGREYLALVHGLPREAGWTIEAPIGRDPVSRVRMAVVPGGKPARTDIRRIGGSAGLGAVRCRLHTGRTHQIRVHLASAGHPLVGDALYGGREALGMSRQALHATRLAFIHPVSRLPLSFHAEPPPDLRQAWDQVVDPRAAGEPRAAAGGA